MPEIPAPRLAGGLWCGEVLERLDSYVDGTLAGPQCDAVDAHLLDCDLCARFGGSYASVVMSLREQLAQPEPLDPAMASRLDAALARNLDG